jgi:hypothetical protein
MLREGEVAPMFQLADARGALHPADGRWWLLFLLCGGALQPFS